MMQSYNIVTPMFESRSIPNDLDLLNLDSNLSGKYINQIESEKFQNKGRNFVCGEVVTLLLAGWSFLFWDPQVLDGSVNIHFISNYRALGENIGFYFHLSISDLKHCFSRCPIT